MISTKKVNWPILFNSVRDKLLATAQRQPNLKNGRNDPYWYDYNCNSLSGLKKTGRGNCVAWSNLAVELAAKNGLRAQSIIIADRRDKTGEKDSHQITIIYDADNTIWFQSCISTRRLYKPRGKENKLRTEKLLCREGAKDCEWKRGAKILRD